MFDRLTLAQAAFLRDLRDGNKLKSPDRAEDYVRTFCRKAGFARFIRKGKKWTLTPLGSATLLEHEFQTASKIAGLNVCIDYTNYRGERAIREIIPQRMFFDKTEYHPETQWLLEAVDVTRQVVRVFAMRDIHSWTPKNDVFDPEGE